MQVTDEGVLMHHAAVAPWPGSLVRIQGCQPCIVSRQREFVHMIYRISCIICIDVYMVYTLCFACVRVSLSLSVCDS